MKSERIDPRHEKLIAYLYGELSESESRAFSIEMEKDETLRLELEELRGTRQLLAGWQVLEPTPSFVFVGEDRKSASGGPTWWRRVVDAVTGGGPAGFGLGLATAAAAALVIALTGFRVERVDGGLAFRVGDENRPVSGAQQPAFEPSPSQLAQSGTPLEMASATPPRPAPSGDPNAYVTRAEVEQIASQMVGSVVDLLNQNGDRQNREFSGVLQTMYEDITDRQSRESEELRQRMNSIGLELLMRQARSKTAGQSAVAPTSIEPRETAPARPLEWKEEWR